MGHGSSVAGFEVLPEVSRKPWTRTCDEEVQFWAVTPSRQNESVLAEWGSPARQCGSRQEIGIRADSKGGWNRRGDF